jgi:hypothetical protein
VRAAPADWEGFGARRAKASCGEESGASGARHELEGNAGQRPFGGPSHRGHPDLLAPGDKPDDEYHLPPMRAFPESRTARPALITTQCDRHRDSNPPTGPTGALSSFVPKPLATRGGLCG